MRLEAAGAALLDDARAVAQRLLDAAEADARGRVDAAHAEAEESIARARAHGEAEGRVEAARAAALERASSRVEVLVARREAYDELRRRAREAALGLRDEAGYPDLLERLSAAARRDLGDGAAVEIDPPGLGGVRARAGSRRVDYTLAALADRCMVQLGASLQRLWA